MADIIVSADIHSFMQAADKAAARDVLEVPQADDTADGTYDVMNDGTPGQLTSITIANGLITGVTVAE